MGIIAALLSQVLDQAIGAIWLFDRSDGVAWAQEALT